MTSEISIEKPRTVLRKLLSKEQGEGVGARVRRTIGRRVMMNLDPFLLLDEFRARPPAGFPDHPHRGFETVTYMLEGAFSHQDFNGHKGIINPGDLQWVTAGRGIVHSEMAATEGENHGLQLWINLASKDKMVPSYYQELQDKDVPKAEKDGVHVSVIAGESMGIKSPVFTLTPTMYLDFTLQPQARLVQKVPGGWNGFIYILQGAGVFGEEDAEEIYAHHILHLGPGDGIKAWNKTDELCRFVLIAGQPLNEPVARHGPIIMNTQEEIKQALMDYHFGENGFEKANVWSSKEWFE